MKKTAAALFAFAAMTGAALADDAQPAPGSRAVLEKIYDAMDKARADASVGVMKEAEARVDEIASLEDAAEPAAPFTVASN